jgi:UDP-glucose 4-epimerase
MSTKVLVTGGAGYIGSVTTAYLIDQGHKVTVLDNLSTGHKESIDRRAKFIYGDVLDNDLTKLIKTNFDAVVHLAGKALVSESIRLRDYYVQNNLYGTKNMLLLMKSNRISKMIFSSTCAVYGNPDTNLISEGCQEKPINPYGESKLLADKEIGSFCNSFEVDAISLRFFNVAGSYKNNNHDFFGEMHDIETHLIPRILRMKEIEIFGSDFDTPDGTCVRDYVHVVDIARAIELSINGNEVGGHKIYNLGSGIGNSVTEVINTYENLAKKKLSRKFMPRRIGDPAYLVSNSSLAAKELKWSPYYNLEQIINDSYEFFLSLKY